jgi:hypothetical protein
MSGSRYGELRRSKQSFHCLVLALPDVIVERAGWKISAWASGGNTDPEVRERDALLVLFVSR